MLFTSRLEGHGAVFWLFLALFLLSTPTATISAGPIELATAQPDADPSNHPIHRENGTEAVERLIETYKEALIAAMRRNDHRRWAGIQTNLGNALVVLGEIENSADALRGAIAAYEAALTISTRERDPLQWAIVQNSMGDALVALGEHETSTESFFKGVAAYEAALSIWTREIAPFAWAHDPESHRHCALHSERTPGRHAGLNQGGCGP